MGGLALALVLASAFASALALALTCMLAPGYKWAQACTLASVHKLVPVCMLAPAYMLALACTLALDLACGRHQASSGTLGALGTCDPHRGFQVSFPATLSVQNCIRSRL